MDKSRGSSTGMRADEPCANRVHGRAGMLTEPWRGRDRARCSVACSEALQVGTPVALVQASRIPGRAKRCDG